MKSKPSELLRKNKIVYKDLDIKEKNFSEDRILNFVIKHPDFIQRPIFEMGNDAILALLPQKIRELL